MAPFAPMERREFLRYIGAGSAGTLLWPAPLLRRASAAPVRGFDLWAPVPYPVPLPGDPGSPADDAARLAQFEVRDDLVLPAGFRYDVLVQWGDRLGPADAPERQIVFGYNADFTALLPTDRPGEYFLFVNHEYISGVPWLQGYEQVYGVALHHEGRVGDLALNGGALELEEAPSGRLETVRGVRALCRAALADLGVSVVRVRRATDGGYTVVTEAPDHRRIHGWGRQNVSPDVPLIITGPCAGLGIQAQGTFANCSGGVTPWGTFLSCEENFQDQVAEDLTPSGRVRPGSQPAFRGEPGLSAAPLPHEFTGLGSGVTPALDARSYGWVCEVDPATGALWKHSALGRFRHENVALRVDTGRPLVAYMGDDRRGGHVWKFVSREPVTDPRDPAHRRLLENGTLYVARFEPDFSGRWIALTPETPLDPIRPEHCSDGVVSLPARPRGGAAVVGADMFAGWRAAIETYTGKPWDGLTLGDLAAGGVSAQAVLLLDAFLMANACGGTPCARPEDIEVHPMDHSVYIAFTDSTGDERGSPATAIFPDSRRESSRQYGALYRIVESDDDPAATHFQWGKFVSSGECAEGGGGFACADNLAFDPEGRLWMVTDITTSNHNFPVNRDGDSAPGNKRFPGVFGNNAMFMIPLDGPQRGQPRCFATGPMDCELAGPWFTDDGCLLLSVQHPGEARGARGRPGVNQPLEIRDREIHIRGRDGAVFVQKRLVPLGSNFPAGQPGAIPKPCVVCIRPG